MIYLDYSANTPVDEAVLQRFCEVERNCPGNANSRHAAGTCLLYTSVLCCLRQ